MKKILFYLWALVLCLILLCGTISADPILIDALPGLQLPMCEQGKIGQGCNDLSDALTDEISSFSDISYGSSSGVIIPFVYRVLKRISPIFNDFVELNGACLPKFHKLTAFAAEENMNNSQTETKKLQQPVKESGKVRALVRTTSPSQDGGYAIQMGAFVKRENAERFQKALRKRYARFNTFILTNETAPFYRVGLGYFQTEADARRHLEVIKKDNLSGVVVRKN